MFVLLQLLIFLFFSFILDDKIKKIAEERASLQEEVRLP